MMYPLRPVAVSASFFSSSLIFFRDCGAGRLEPDVRFALHIVIVQPIEAIRILLDIFDVLFNLLRVGIDLLLVGRNVLLVAEIFC
jgi:hypothetical protein